MAKPRLTSTERIGLMVCATAVAAILATLFCVRNCAPSAVTAPQADTVVIVTDSVAAPKSAPKPRKKAKKRRTPRPKAPARDPLAEPIN